MLNALLIFLIGALVLVVIVYVAKLILDLLTLPDNIRQLALIIVGLIGLIAIIMLAANALRGGGLVLLPGAV